jgi:hypothetical protein
LAVTGLITPSASLAMVGDKSPLHSLTSPGVLVDSQYEHPKHPPDKEYRHDGPGDVNYPVASRFWFPKIEHAAMLAGWPYILTSLIDRSIRSPTFSPRRKTGFAPHRRSFAPKFLRRPRLLSTGVRYFEAGRTRGDGNTSNLIGVPRWYSSRILQGYGSTSEALVRKKCSTGESGTAMVCRFCDGKG